MSGDYNIHILGRAKEKLLGLPIPIKERVEEVIDSLAINPHPAKSQPDPSGKFYVVPTANRRIIYTVDHPNKKVSIYDIIPAP